tara:strand:- start:54 stop:329 length:276 start_codon:yes stop_codon:yes gene_type:complete
MAEKVKFTKDELKEVQNIQNQYLGVQNNFGQVSIARMRLQAQINSLNETEAKLGGDFGELQKKEQEFLNKVTEKYGQGTLDPQTGVFTANK